MNLNSSVNSFFKSTLYSENNASASWKDQMVIGFFFYFHLDGHVDIVNIGIVVDYTQKYNIKIVICVSTII